MQPNEYQKLASRTECNQMRANTIFYIDHPLSTRLNHAVLGLSGEVGELAGALERWLHYGLKLDLTNVKEEIGDCLWYIALACNALEVDLSDVMESNIAKLRKRYPDKFDKAQAKEQNRDRQAERDTVRGDKTECKVNPKDQKELTDTYNRFCNRCHLSPVFKHSKTGICPDCAADLRAKNV